MKLRTKLIVAFMSVMILPMIFLNVVMHTFASREVGELQQLYMIVVFITTTLLIYSDLPFGFCSAGETAEGGKKYQGRES